MYKIKLGYDSLLLTYSNYERFGDIVQKVFSLPGYDQGDYVHEWEKQAGNQHIFCKTKNEIENEFNIKFPVHLNESQTLFNSLFLENTYNFCCTDIALLRRMQEVELIEDTVDNFLDRDEEFIYPYSVINEKFFTVDIPLPPNRVIEAVKQGKAKIVFFYGAEGHTYNIGKIKKLVEFTKKIGVEVHYYHSNLKLSEAYEQWKKIIPNQTTHKLKVHRFSAFEVDPWCVRLDRTNNYNVKALESSYHKKVNEHRVTKNVINPNNLKKFLIFNRRPRLYRKLIHAAVMSDDNLKINSYTGIENNIHLDEQISLYQAKSDHLYHGKRIFNYIDKNREQYKNNGYELDVNLNENQAFNFPLSFYYNSLISVVTETETHKDCVFFTEKIFKAILGLHPFIMITSPYFLQTLKDEGYQTFDRFWDESYDLIEDDDLRFSAVLKLIEDLNTKSIFELTEMYFEMKDVLQYNYYHFIHNSRHINYLRSLEEFKGIGLI